jgi:hypothetical protein
LFRSSRIWWSWGNNANPNHFCITNSFSIHSKSSLSSAYENGLGKDQLWPRHISIILAVTKTTTRMKHRQIIINTRRGEREERKGEIWSSSNVHYSRIGWVVGCLFFARGSYFNNHQSSINLISNQNRHAVANPPLPNSL